MIDNSYKYSELTGKISASPKIKKIKVITQIMVQTLLARIV